MKTLKIRDFIQGRNVSYDTVRKYIINHSEVFEGHVGKTNNINLDEEAFRVLDEKYPLSRPVQVIEDTERVNNLISRIDILQEKYIAVIEENKRLMQQNASLMLAHQQKLLMEEELEGHKELLKQLEKKNKSLESTNAVLEDNNYHLMNDNMELVREKEQLINKLREETEKSWWKKLLKK